MKIAAMLALLAVAASWIGLGANTARADTQSGQVSHIYMNLRDQASGTAAGQYWTLLESLRNASGHYWRNGIGITQTYGEANTLIRMDLNLSDTEELRLWFNPRNLYLLGFTNHNNDTYAFNDSNLGAIMANAALNGSGNLLPPQGQIHNLSFGSNYQSLSGAAGYGREAMPISLNDLWNSAWQLQYGGNSSSTARSLMLMIQYTSEAARFWDVYGVMSDIMRNPGRFYDGLPLNQVELEQHWEQLSRLADDLWSGRPITPVYVGPHAGTFSSSSQLTARLMTVIGNPGSVPPSDEWWHTEL